MWVRSELKAKGKASFKANYWKSVLMALVLAIAIGGTALASGASGAPGAVTQPATVEYDSYATEGHDGSDYDGDFDKGDSVDFDEDGIDVKSDGDSVYVDEDGIEVDAGDGDHVHIVNPFQGVPLGVYLAFAAGALLIGLVVAAASFAVDAFLLNPLEVGSRKFFLTNLNRPAETKELASGFDNNYLQGVKTMFLRDLFTCLWSLLFVIPGIVKSYEYRMIPYLIAENPQMGYKAAFAESKRLTDGQKWNMFVLDLSFLGWDLLSAMTFGLLSLFYVGPYRAATEAALYEALRYGNGYQPQAGLPQGTVPPAGTGQPVPVDPSMGYAQPMPFAQQPVQPVEPQKVDETPAPIPMPPVSEPEQPADASNDPGDTPDDLLE